MDKARPLWKRALWHSLKYLLRRHPLAALSAAGAGMAFAGQEAMRQGRELLKEKISLCPDGDAAQAAALSVHVAEPPEPASNEDPPDQPAGGQRPAEKTGAATDPGDEEREREAFWKSLSPEARQAVEKLAAARKRPQ